MSNVGDAQRTQPRYMLPREAYFSQEWFDREQDQLFSKIWTWIGWENECHEIGGYITGMVGRNPIVAIRSENGLQAFHNICRHRGAILLEGKGNVKRGITCFYHRWHYQMNGELRAVPQQDKFPCLDKTQLGLKRAACSVWNGMVFVHADAEPGVSLVDWLGEFPLGHGPWNASDLQLAGSDVHEVQANWKLFIENHIDGYHLLHLHARSIEGLDHKQQRWNASGRHYTFREPRISDQILPEQIKKGSVRLPFIEGVTPDHFGSTVHMLFPNVGLAGGGTYYAAFRVIPVAPERCRVETSFFTAALGYKDLLKNPPLWWQALKGNMQSKKPKVTPSNPDGDFIGEDIFAAQSLQRALRSDRFEVGPLSLDFEESIQAFHKNILDFL